jgi:hypothetical protein
MADGLAGRCELPPRRAPNETEDGGLRAAHITSVGLPVAVLLVAAILGASASAQVTVNPQALEPLTGGPPAAAPKPAPKPRPTHPAPSHTAPVHPTPVPPTPPRAPPPIVAPVPPPPAALAPLSPPPPAHPIEAPPAAPIVPDAAGTAMEIPGGIRVTFGATSADINVITDYALRHLARASPNGNFTITAFASGVPDDPSTPRRLSLSRALAARSLLMAEGVPSTRINVRALGPNNANGPADRVDVTVTAPPEAKP